MQTTKLLFSLVLFCSACGNKNESTQASIKFESAKWNIKEDGHYTYRKQMVDDLLKNYKWTGIKKDSIIKLLGEPDEIEDNIFMIYDINQSPFGFAPFSSKSLIIELAADSTVKVARK